MNDLILPDSSIITPNPSFEVVREERPFPSTPEELMILGRDDPRYIIESGFVVVNKDKEVVPFIFNRLQNEFYNNRTTRDDILKGSQFGFSTMILAILTTKFLLVPNSWSVSISYNDDATSRLFEKVDFWLNPQNLPEWLRPFLRLSIDRHGDLKNEVMNSRFYIGTAGAKSFGRGDTIHYAHLSEVSRWKDSGTVATNILRAMPINDPYTWAVKETTANGQGNYHHKEWKRAKDGLSAFRPHFFAWFKHEEYKIIGAVIGEENYDEDEKRLKRRFPEWIDDERLTWRREMIRTLQSENGRTPEEMFKQEFPADDEEAFLFSGNPIFPVEQLKNYKEWVKPPAFTGNISGIAPNINLDATEQGWLKIWKKPEANAQYVIFADVGQVADFCVATVVNKKTWEVVAKFRTVMESHAFGDELYKLGFFYNKCLIAVEVNNMGQSTIDRLRTLEYPHIYMRERLNEKTKQVSKEYGWMTTTKSKALMIGHMQDLIRREEVEIPDEDIINEMATFVNKGNGIMEASDENHDDCVMSCSGAYYILKLHPFVENKSIIKKKTASPAQRYRRLRGGSR